MINELDLKSLWKELDEYEIEMEKETTSLQEVWLKIAEIKTKNENDLVELMKKEEFSFLDSDLSIGLNVGGQLFETDVKTLTKDPYSVLAACCRVKSPITPNNDGIIYFDRDWWLFRHIIAFLRSNALPNELETLKELYIESSYYRLESLQRAIENISIDQVTNINDQVSVTWPGLMDGGPNPLRRLPDSHIMSGSLYKNI